MQDRSYIPKEILSRKLNKAIIRMDFKKIKKLIDKYEIDITQNYSISESVKKNFLDKFTPFINYACEKNELNKLKEIREIVGPTNFKVCINHWPDYQDTALITAAKKTHIDIIKYLISCGANENNKDHREDGYIEILLQKINKLLREGQYENVINLIDNFDSLKQDSRFKDKLSTWISHYVCNGDLDKLVELKMHFGYEYFVYIINSEENSILCRAAQQKQIEALRWLIDIGCNKKLTNYAGENYETILEKDIIDKIKNNNFKMAITNINKFNSIISTDVNTNKLIANAIIEKINFAIKDSEIRLLIEIKDTFGEGNFRKFLTIVENTNGSALIRAAKNKKLRMAKWLLNFGANPLTQSSSGQTYLDILSKHIIENIYSENYKSAANILSSFKEINIEKSINNSSIIQCITHIIINAQAQFNKGTLSKINSELFKELNLGLSFDEYLNYCALLNATQKNDLDYIKKHINSKTLNLKIPKNSLSLMELAISLNFKDIAQHLFECGAIVNPDIESKENTNCNFTNISKISNSIIKNISTTINTTRETKTADEIHQLLEKSLENFKKHKYDIYQELDFTLTFKMLTKSLKDKNNPKLIQTNLKNIFKQRENAIINTRLDYCYALKSPANMLCHEIAKTIDPENPYNILYSDAISKDRETPWYDPYAGTEATYLPSAKRFYRTKNNEIHIYEYILEQAFTHLKSGKNLMSTVWFGTDSKMIKPVPPLNTFDFQILKQKSETLSELIEYTEDLETHTKFVAETDIYQRFILLRDKLYAGDYRSTKSHRIAGNAAYIAIAEFADWWNTLKIGNPILCRSIREFSSSRNGETIGNVLNILFDQNNLHNGERENDVSYCINIKANILDRILTSENIIQKFTELKPDSQHRSFKSKTILELKDLRSKINAEIKDSPDNLIYGDINSFLPRQFLELNLLLVKNNIVSSYKDLITAPSKVKDSKRILDYIISEIDNAHLLRLQKLLDKQQFFYLRDGSSISLFDTHYYALINGKRICTNKQFSQLQSAIAAKIVLNETKVLKDKVKARTKIEEIYKEYDFLRCNRKFILHLSNNTKYKTIFNGKTPLAESKKLAEEELVKISSEFFSP